MAHVIDVKRVTGSVWHRARYFALTGSETGCGLLASLRGVNVCDAEGRPILPEQNMASAGRC